MPLRPPDPRTIGTNRQLADLEDRVLNMQHQQGGACNVETGSIQRIETTLDAILRELAKINSHLALSAKSQEPEKGAKKTKKSVLYK